SLPNVAAFKARNIRPKRPSNEGEVPVDINPRIGTPCRELIFKPPMTVDAGHECEFVLAPASKVILVGLLAFHILSSTFLSRNRPACRLGSFMPLLRNSLNGFDINSASPTRNGSPESARECDADENRVIIFE